MLFRSSLKNIRFIQDKKLRFIFACMTLGMLVSTISLFEILTVVNRALTNVPTNDPAIRGLLDQINDVITHAIFGGMILSLCTVIVALLFGLMVSHRYNGPVVPLARHLRTLREGNYASRVTLRPGDELGELRDAQNQLAEELEKRHGAGAQP